MTLVRKTLCRLRPMFNSAVSQTRAYHGPNLYGPPQVRASFPEKVVLGVILMTITIGPGCWFLSETSKIRAIAREAEQDDD